MRVSDICSERDADTHRQSWRCTHDSPFEMTRARFCLQDRGHADSSDVFLKRVIHSDGLETFSFFSCFLSFYQAMYACRQMLLHLYVFDCPFQCLSKRAMLWNNSRKVLAILLHDNSNISALGNITQHKK